MEEIWKDIPRYEGKYKVSNTGKVKSLPRTRMNSVGFCYYAGKELRQSQKKNGYMMVCLYNNGMGKHFLTHTLVLLAFAGEVKEGEESRHKDGNRENNNIENLCYGTRKENYHDSVIHNTNCQGERHGMNKLKSGEIWLIKKICSFNIPQRKIAKMFKMAQTSISRINRGATYLSANIGKEVTSD